MVIDYVSLVIECIFPSNEKFNQYSEGSRSKDHRLLSLCTNE